jgi:signal transduction histidine kinase
MNLRAWLLLTLGGLLASILVVSGAGSFATLDLAKRIETLDHVGALARQLEKIENARRRYQSSGTANDLKIANGLIAETSDEVAIIKKMSKETGDQVALIQKLDDAFQQYRQLLGAYADSEARKTEASATMATQLNNLKAMAKRLKDEKESDYHRSFAHAGSISDAKDQLRTTLRLAALANELIVAQMSIERAVALFRSGDELGAAEIPFEIGRIAEIADRIRHIEQVLTDHERVAEALTLPDQIVSRSNQFQSGYDSFRLATREQNRRAEEMADVAIGVTELIQEIKALQAKAAVLSSERTLALSLLGVATALILGVLAVMVMRNRIIAPLMAITKIMRQMSDGQLELAVPGHERRDELGAMARALEVFRQNSLEARRLAEENVEVERRLAKERAEAVFLEQSLEKEKELNAQQRRFVSLVSHEFRTPLAIIDGQAQRLIRRGDKVEADQRAVSLQKVRNSVQRLTDLMESVLSSASLEAGSITFNKVPMDLRALVQKACDGQQEIS